MLKTLSKFTAKVLLLASDEGSICVDHERMQKFFTLAGQRLATHFFAITRQGPSLLVERLLEHSCAVKNKAH